MDNSDKNISYKEAGVNIDAADELKRQIRTAVSSHKLDHCAPLNRVGAFASLVELDLAGYKKPIFILKSEEPGSKQILSIDNGRAGWIAADLINHLVNDIIVTGATPCAVLDTIICGKLEGETVFRLVDGMSKACRDNGCVLVGGETSEQPGVLPEGRYILQASILGVADRDKIIDGAAIQNGDVLIALASNGLHTNGYSLVRKLMEAKPEILGEHVGGRSFMESILLPHTPYAAAVKALLGKHPGAVSGMAHITGGGMRDNLVRILNGAGLRAAIDLQTVRVPPVFGVIKRYAGTDDADMLRTFNNGVGMILAVRAESADAVIRGLREFALNGNDVWPGLCACGDDYAYKIGSIVPGERGVEFLGSLNWDR